MLLVAIGRADREWHILVSDRYCFSITRQRVCGMVELATGGEECGQESEGDTDCFHRQTSLLFRIGL